MLLNHLPIDPKAKENIQIWLSDRFDPETHQEVHRLLSGDLKILEDAFYTRLTFGTGGMRGLMGPGCNRINKHTIAFATEGLSNYLKKIFKGAIKVFIGYDTRLHSKEFAFVAARVLAGHSIQVYLNKEICPTPFTSFSCRYYKCQAAIMVTASHNPAAYNGFKIYWQDGGQVLPPHDEAIVVEANKISDPTQVHFAPISTHFIQEVGEEAKKGYFSSLDTLINRKEANQIYGKQLHIVYSNLHGTGITLTPPLLLRWGFSNLSYVEEQTSLDGRFPTVIYPNPEEKESLAMGIKTLLEKQGDLLIVQDPDADRMRALILHQGKPVYFTGNQMACLLLHHILTHRAKKKNLSPQGACVKTIVTTNLFKHIANEFSVPCFEVLTGFKYISALIEQWEAKCEEYRYIFGGEESYGTLAGTFSRDKDGVIAAALTAELALETKLEGKTLLDRLHDIYHHYGVFGEINHCLHFPETKEGKEKVSSYMKLLRNTPPKQIDGKKVITYRDYLFIQSTFPISNVLEFHLEDSSKLVIRPSGTEPKIKIYAEASSPTIGSIEQTERNIEQKCQRMINEVLNMTLQNS